VSSSAHQVDPDETNHGTNLTAQMAIRRSAFWALSQFEVVGVVRPVAGHSKSGTEKV
jgi:hypothetical protein